MIERQRSIQGVLRQARWSTGLTQEELAARCGVSVRTISDIERGHVMRPRATTLRQLALGLAMTEEDTRNLLLLGRTGQDAGSGHLVAAEAPGRGAPALPGRALGPLAAAHGRSSFATAARQAAPGSPW
jgi:transcriptional regulator with XRE-family HTH domain